MPRTHVPFGRMHSTRGAALQSRTFAVLALGLLAGCAGSNGPREEAAPPVAVAAPAFPAQDPAVLRMRTLAKLDAQIDELAGLAHMNARLMLDEVMPIPYLGVDANPDGGGMRVAHVYPMTAAERAGLVEGDLLLALSGVPTTSKATLGSAIRSHAVGDSIDLEVLRGGARVVLRSALGNRPEEDEDEEEQFPDIAIGPEFTHERLAFDFGSDAAGALPAAFEHVLGGHGDPPRFEVIAEGDARFLRQSSQDTRGIHFPMALARSFRAKDAIGRARFRFTGGRVDRAAGVVLRFKDRFNYLVARVNAAEADLRIFRVAHGVRHTLPGGRIAAPCDDGAWHTLEFKVEGSTLTATFDGVATATACDSWFLEGRAGVWTKSDSVTDFDDVEFAPID